jgi:hypothetical protein
MRVAAGSGMVTLLGLEPEGYERHPLHGAERTYGETNCYTDIVLELLHARGDEPLAMLGHLVRQDFEGDQWTFFKPPPGDLELLYGVDIHEMQPWRSLGDQVAEQLAAGRTMIVELDSWFLPDTAATDYRTNHVKTSVAFEGIDREGERLRYFHNAGLHELSGEDYRGALRLGGGWSPEVLPPYAELVRFDAGPRLCGDTLRDVARGLLANHLVRRPADNPFERFADRLELDLPALLEGDAAAFHAYAFPTVRMAGASFELLAEHLRWLLEPGEAAPAVGALERVVGACKVLGFRLARRRPFEPRAVLGDATAAWDEAMGALAAIAA